MEHKYLDCDFYWVELNEDGNKVIHPYGFVYDAEESDDEDEPDLTYRFQTYSYGFTFLPEEMEQEDFDYNTLCCDNIDFDETEDIDEQEAYTLLDNSLYVNEPAPTELPIDMVDSDTPCGWYVNYSKHF